MTKQEWVDYYRKKYPNRSDAEINKLAEEQLKLQGGGGAGGYTGITFGDTGTATTGTGDAGVSATDGVRIGFGLTDANGDALILRPSSLPSYMQVLLLKNPKAYASVQNLVYQATGKKYSDPDALGVWLQTVAVNLQGSIRQDPTLAGTNIETVVNAAIVNRASSSLFGSQTAAERVPTRQIYRKTKEEVEQKINEDAQNILGRDITPEDMNAQWYKDLRKAIRGLYDQGIVTTTERVKNPKTGKMETRVLQVPGFSEAKVSEMTSEALKQADPISVERKKNLEFANWAFEKMGGRG